MNDQPRRAERVPLKCEAEFRRHGDHRYVVELIDLSPEGCCLSPPVRVDIGESVWLRVPEMEAIHGRIAWVKQWKAGVEFDRPFHQAVFNLVVERLKEAGARKS